MRWNKTFTVVGCHAEGEVGNVVVGGIVDVPGETMFEKKEYLEHSMDEIRGLLLFEPRGAPYVNANIILPACEAGSPRANCSGTTPLPERISTAV